MIGWTSDNSLREGTRIALVSNTSWYLLNFRSNLIRRLADLGLSVTAIAPDNLHEEAVRSAGAEFLLWRLDRRSTSLVSNAAALASILNIYLTLHPDLVHHFTIKPVILGGTAARTLRIRGIVQAITGLGHAFSRSSALERTALTGYRFALRGRAYTVFQNNNDMEKLLSSGVLARSRCRLIRGSGVDVERFVNIPLPPAGAPVTFLMSSRMLWAKGVREFAEAAALVRKRLPNTRFLLVGAPDEGSPDAIPVEWLENLTRSGIVEWRPFTTKIEPLLAESHVVVLPSIREGLPKSLLEGAAARRALIASDAPGCREITLDGATGLLVPIANSPALAEAMIHLAESPDLRASYGETAQNLACREFASEIIVEQTLALYREALS